MSSFAMGKTVSSVHEQFAPGSEHRSPEYYQDPRNIGRNVESAFRNTEWRCPGQCAKTLMPHDLARLPRELTCERHRTHSYSMLHHLLSTVSEAGPVSGTVGLRGLTELLPSLPSPLALADNEKPSPQSGEQTLQLIATAQLLLYHLEADESSSPLPWRSPAAFATPLTNCPSRWARRFAGRGPTRVRGLYVIIDPQVTGGRDPFDIAVAAVQRRSKDVFNCATSCATRESRCPLPWALQDLCQRHGALLIINDHADVAAAVGSGGLHFGQTDLPVAQARQILAPHQVLGRSNREFEQLAESKEMGADHVAFGAIYATTSKGVARNPQGPERVCARRKPSPGIPP